MNVFLVELLDGRYEPAILLGITQSLNEAILKIEEIGYEQVENPLKDCNGVLISKVELGDFNCRDTMKFYNYLGVELFYK